MKTVIVGGVAGGASAAARLRRLDERAEIILIERGAYISFANCGLPYYIGGEIRDASDLTLQTPEAFNKRFRIDVRVEHELLAIDAINRTVTVKNKASGREYREYFDKLIVAVGAEPIRPPIPGIGADKVFTLRNIPDTMRIKRYIDHNGPEEAAVVGGGFIGMEMAENLKRAGLAVTIIEQLDHLIPAFDAEMAADIHHYVRSKGIRLHLNDGVREIAEKEDRLEIRLGKSTLHADLLLLSVGVRPESAIAKAAGIELNPRGAIAVDGHMRTSVKDIYAVGDVAEVRDFITGDTAFVPLAGPANKQGRIAADHIAGIASRYEGTQGSAILKIFDMTIAATGINERTAQNKGYDYDKVYLYSASHAGYYPGAEYMSIKVLFERGSGKLLGAQIVGFDGVDKRCDVLAAAIRLGAKASDLTRLELCYAPPFGSAKDPVNMAGYVIENLENGIVKQFHWHDVKDLTRDGGATLLDVRTGGEAAGGMIPGFRHIPLDELRDHIDGLDKGKPVYLYCFSGMRSYLACRILMGYGFNCSHLSGGYRLYHAIMEDYAVIKGR